MFLQGFGSASHSLADSVLLCSPCLAPKWSDVRVRELLQPVDERECGSQGAAKDDLRRQDVTVRVGGVVQLLHGPQEAVMIDAACRASSGH